MPEQLFDQKLKFCSNGSLDGVSQEVNSKYNVITVVGSQGSGCSTLSNDLFDTDFLTMGADVDVTTDGIWQAWSTQFSSVVLDPQGWSGEKSRDDNRKFAAFVAATSSIILLNLKQDEISRCFSQHGEMIEAICKTILEKYDQNDSLRSCTTLLFVIRDWDGTINEESAIAKLTDIFAKVWEECSALLDMGEISMQDYFKLAVTTLPHRHYDQDGYQEQIQQLRERFTPTSTDSLLPQPTRGDVPLKHLFGHMGSIWRTIRGIVSVTEKRQSLSEKMCPLFVNAALQVSRREIKRIVDVEAAAHEFRRASDKCRETALAEYERRSRLYDANVVATHRANLLAEVEAELRECYALHLKSLRSIALSEFKQRLVNLQKNPMPGPPMPSKVLLPKIEQLKDDCVKVFRDLAEAARLQEEWSCEDEIEALIAGMEQVAAPVREQQASIDLSIERSLAVFSRPLSPLIDISKMLSESTGIGRMMMAAFWRA